MRINSVSRTGWSLFGCSSGVYLDYWAVAKSERRWTSSLWTPASDTDTKAKAPAPSSGSSSKLWQKQSWPLTDWLTEQVQGYCANSAKGRLRVTVQWRWWWRWAWGMPLIGRLVGPSRSSKSLTKVALATLRRLGFGAGTMSAMEFIMLMILHISEGKDNSTLPFKMRLCLLLCFHGFWGI